MDAFTPFTRSAPRTSSRRCPNCRAIKESHMSTLGVVNGVLWSVQVFLALFFLAASVPKILGRGIERWTGFSDLPRAEVVFIGVMELFGAIGLVLPMATGILPWLTPLAALGLAVNVLMAAGFHVRADERLEALETGLWDCLAGMNAICRLDLLARFCIPAMHVEAA